ncbi:MAG: D-aminoacylase [Longimicrobiales bacterium]|nr:D-aminoacylase [Longimicrobiales bacterium]
MRRRTFVQTSALAATGTFFAPEVVLGRARADLVLRGATVFDGTGAPGREQDVAVTGDRIAAMGPNLPAGSEEMDLRGLALAPGFIDIHTHVDMPIFENPNVESRIRQGVTLEVGGNCGGSPGPWSEEEFQQTRTRYRERYGVEIDFRDPAGFLGGIDRLRPAVNAATLVGNGSLRSFAVGNEDRPATDAEIAVMKEEFRKALAGGCVGLSSGLEYTPSGFARPDELIAIASVMKGTGYPYASHMRNEDDRVLGAIEELFHVGRMAGVPVQISHLKAQGQRNHWKQEAILTLLAEARESGLDARFDAYPYVAYSTGLTNLFPTDMRSGGTQAFLQRLRDPATGPRLEAYCRGKIAGLGDWNNIQITSASESTPWARGRKLGDLAAERGMEPYALVLMLLEDNRGSMGTIGYGMSEENVEELLAHPLGMVCSDGSNYAPYGRLAESSPHPRSYGTFPRLLGHYVRERKVLPLEEAIRKVTSAPADRMRLEGRGRIAVGAFADLVAFDPDTVIDRATFEAPHQYPTGMPLVIVNGVVTIRDGEQSGQRGGRGIRGAARV